MVGYTFYVRATLALNELIIEAKYVEPLLL